MSELSRKARRANRAKAHRMATQQAGKVDCSSYGPEEDANTTTQTGMRPLSRRNYKRGGKVEGEDAKHHAGRMPRKAGGAAKWADEYVNRDSKEANTERAGARKTDEGGLKRGGRAKRDVGGEVPTTRFNIGAGESIPRKMAGFKKGGEVHSDEKEDRALVKKMVKSKALTGKCEGGELDGEMQGTRPTGGRRARKSGGGNWIAGAIKHPGALHKELHVPEGKKIPAKKLAKAAHSDNPKLAKRARLAETLKRMHRKDGGRTKGGKTDINIIIGAKSPSPMGGAPMPGAPGSAPIPVPVGPPALGATGPALPGAPPPAAPPMGAPGMPLPRKRGGRAYKADGGNITADDARDIARAVNSIPSRASQSAAAYNAVNSLNANEGAAKAAARLADSGYGNALPRKRGGRTYASYKDMDAGAGSGEGRLEKTEIAKRKK